MARGPKPQGDRALTPAERQARYRASRAGTAPPLVKVVVRRPVDRRSRARRWSDAVAELLAVQEDYREWLDSLPENLQASATADALRAICEADLSEIESLQPPRGFGRD